MKLQILKNINELPQIKLEDVENNCFSTSLGMAIGAIIQQVEEREGRGKENIFDYFNTEERYIYEIFMLHRSLISCLETIDMAIGFISSYSKKDYMKKSYIPFDKYSLYHYDVICHKVSTIKDLYYKIINLVYELKLKNCNWKSLQKEEQNINNAFLFELLEANYKLVSNIEDKRNKSSHEGVIRHSLLSDIGFYLMVVDLQDKVPQFTPAEEKYSKNSLIYSDRIKKAKKDFLANLRVVRYNVCSITRCLLCAMSVQLELILRKKTPNVNYKGSESVCKCSDNCLNN